MLGLIWLWESFVGKEKGKPNSEIDEMRRKRNRRESVATLNADIGAQTGRHAISF